MPILFGTIYLMMDIYVLLCVTKERYGYISIYLNLFGGFPSFSEAWILGIFLKDIKANTGSLQ